MPRDTRPRLNVFNWSSYVGPETIPDFEREFNVRVRYAVYESNEEMLARVMTGNSGWDVVFPTSLPDPADALLRVARPTRSQTAAEPASSRSSRFRSPCGIPSCNGASHICGDATGICHTKHATEEITSWADMWEPEFQGRITMLDDPVDVFAACLKKLGYSINTQNPDELRAAQQEAMEQKELLRAYINAEVRDQLVAGDVLAAQLWSNTAQQAMDEAKDLAFVYPEEGFLLYADNAVILRESKRTDLAHEFLNYLLRPKVAAGIVMGARAACPNASARALLPEDTRNLRPYIHRPRSWRGASGR